MRWLGHLTGEASGHFSPVPGHAGSTSGELLCLTYCPRDMIPDKCQKMDGSTEALNVLFKCLCSLFICIVSVYSKGYHIQWPECTALVLGMLKNVILHMNTKHLGNCFLRLNRAFVGRICCNLPRSISWLITGSSHSEAHTFLTGKYMYWSQHKACASQSSRFCLNLPLHLHLLFQSREWIEKFDRDIWESCRFHVHMLQQAGLLACLHPRWEPQQFILTSSSA